MTGARADHVSYRGSPDAYRYDVPWNDRSVTALVDQLVARFGQASVRTRRWRRCSRSARTSCAGLVDETGLSRRTVEAVLQLLDARRVVYAYRLDGLPDGVAAHVRPRPV